MESPKAYKVVISKANIPIGISQTFYDYTKAINYATRHTFGSQVAVALDSETVDNIIPRRPL